MIIRLSSSRSFGCGAMSGKRVEKFAKVSNYFKSFFQHQKHVPSIFYLSFHIRYLLNFHWTIALCFIGWFRTRWTSLFIWKNFFKLIQTFITREIHQHENEQNLSSAELINWLCEWKQQIRQCDDVINLLWLFLKFYEKSLFFWLKSPAVKVKSIRINGFWYPQFFKGVIDEDILTFNIIRPITIFSCIVPSEARWTFCWCRGGSGPSTIVKTLAV